MGSVYYATDLLFVLSRIINTKLEVVFFKKKNWQHSDYRDVFFSILNVVNVLECHQ